VRVQPGDTICMIVPADRMHEQAWLYLMGKNPEADPVSVLAFFARRELAQLLVAEPGETIECPSRFVATVCRIADFVKRSVAKVCSSRASSDDL